MIPLPDKIQAGTRHIRPSRLQGQPVGSRAVLRLVQPSTEYPEATCAACEERIPFSARTRPTVVTANVYERGTWDRVEHWHPRCYEAAGEPYGQPA